MKPIEIIVIIAAVAIVAGVIIASIVRKLKGKPSLGSDCAGCSHAGQCNGKCCSNQGNVDWTELVKQRKAELEAQKRKTVLCPKQMPTRKRKTLTATTRTDPPFVRNE